MQVIAICGLKRCGKDTVANYIQHKFEYKHVKISQPLKDVCAYLFNWSQNQLEDNVKDVIDPKWGITPRDAMKFFGTEVMQFKLQELLPNVKREFWVRKLIESSSEKKIVISDVRFMHEYDVLKSNCPNLIVIKIAKHEKLITYDTHSSETEWKRIKEDYFIQNDGSISELYDKIDVILH